MEGQEVESLEASRVCLLSAAPQFLGRIMVIPGQGKSNCEYMLNDIISVSKVGPQNDYFLDISLIKKFTLITA